MRSEQLLNRPQNTGLGNTRLDGTGLEIVFHTEEEVVAELFGRSTRKVISSLHRRFWQRRCDMLQARALDLSIASPQPDEDESLRSGALFVDLADRRLDWEARLSELASVVGAGWREQVPGLGVRGWIPTESGVLVDGCAVPGCIVDVAVSMHCHVEQLRSGRSPFVIHIPVPADEIEARLWRDLIKLAEDRFGVERGTLEVLDRSGRRLDGRPELVAV